MTQAEFPVLIVDDSKSMRAMIRAHLKEYGFKNFSEASNGEEAIHLLLAQPVEDPFKLIVTDWNMPEMNGIQLLQFVRNKLGGPAPKVLMITSENEKGSLLKAVKEGIDGYVTKPFSSSSFAAAIRKIFPKVA